MKWFRYLEIIGWSSLIIFFINMSRTNYSAGILIYKGFIPQPWEVMFPFIWLIFCLISLGAEIENGIKRHKNPGVIV